MCLTNFFKRKPRYSFTGALPDTRTLKEKEKDYLQKEVLAFASPVEWKEKSQWRTFPVLNQGQQNSCVANTMAKLLGVMYFLRDGQYLDFSRSDIYRRRVNKPGAGMVGNDAFQIAQEGVTLNSLLQSDQPSDAGIDALVVEKFKSEIGSVLKINNYLTIQSGDFETVASTIQATGKAVMVWFYFTANEWSQKFPKIIDANLSSSNGLRHSVTAVDFGLINGKKYIKIEDSAHFGGINERWISEDFFKARNFYAAYALNFRFDTPITKPKYISDNVVSLQDCLKAELLFPISVDSTGYFGSITKNAVIAFQVKYGLNPPLGNVGSLTKAKLHELYP